MNKYFKTTKSLRKPVVSMTLDSIAFNGSKKIHYVMPQWE